MHSRKNHDDYDLQARYYDRNPLSPELRAFGSPQVEDDEDPEELNFDHSCKARVTGNGLYNCRGNHPRYGTSASEHEL